MACTLTTGRSLPCKSAVGGLKAVYFANYGTLGNVTIEGGEITAFSEVSIEFFKFDIKGNSSLETTINSSRENGTSFYSQVLNLTLTYLDAATQEELKIIVAARPHIAVEDYNGNFFMLGLEHGAEVTGGTIVTGAAMGDLSGFTLTMEAQETSPAYFVDGTIITDDNIIGPQINP